MYVIVGPFRCSESFNINNNKASCRNSVVNSSSNSSTVLVPSSDSITVTSFIRLMKKGLLKHRRFKCRDLDRCGLGQKKERAKWRNSKLKVKIYGSQGPTFSTESSLFQFQRVNSCHQCVTGKVSSIHTL